MAITLDVPRSILIAAIEKGIDAGSIDGKPATKLRAIEKGIDKVAFGQFLAEDGSCGCPLVEAGYVSRELGNGRIQYSEKLPQDKADAFMSAFDTAMFQFVGDQEPEYFPDYLTVSDRKHGDPIKASDLKVGDHFTTYRNAPSWYTVTDIHGDGTFDAEYQHVDNFPPNHVSEFFARGDEDHPFYSVDPEVVRSERA